MIEENQIADKEWGMNVKHVFIVNPTAGKANAVAFLEPQIHAAAQKLGVDYEIVHTKRMGHAGELARAYAQTGDAVRLYACGGDGTLNEVFYGAYTFPNAEVASVPCGSGNDFVRNYGLAGEFLNLEDNMSGTAICIDLMRANEGVSMAISSVGLDANVAYAIPSFRRIPLCGGSTAYNLSILKALLGHLSRKMRVELDGDVQEDEFTIAAVCNGIAYGGGYQAAPTANLQDGLLEVVLVKKLSRLRIAGVLKLYKAGKHIEADEQVTATLRDVMQYRKAKHVTIVPSDAKPVVVNIDGECAPLPGLQTDVLPGAARFVLPQSVYARNPQMHGAVSAQG